MTCDKCEYLKIIYEPLWMEGITVDGIPLELDFGKAKCLKHSLYVYFLDYEKFKTLTCPKEFAEDIDVPNKMDEVEE